MNFTFQAVDEVAARCDVPMCNDYAGFQVAIGRAAIWYPVPMFDTIIRRGIHYSTKRRSEVALRSLFQTFVEAVHATCCSSEEGSADCSSGMPASCDADCPAWGLSHFWEGQTLFA